MNRLETHVVAGVRGPTHPTFREIVFLGALTAIPSMAIDLYLPGLPSIAADLAATPAVIARTVSAYFVGIALGQLVYGPVSDRLGRKKPLLFGICLYSIASALCMVAPSANALIVGRLMQAAGGCAAFVIPRAIVRDHFGYVETARALSMLTLVMGVVPILAPLLGAFILSLTSWQALFGILTLFGVVAASAIRWRLSERRPPSAVRSPVESAFGSYRALLVKKRLVGYLLTGAFNGACFFTYIAASPMIIIGYLHFPPERFGWVFGVNSVGLIGMSQVNRVLLTRFTPEQVLSVSVPAIVTFALILYLCAETQIGGVIGILGPLFLISATYGFISANTTAGALSVDPGRAGSASALIGSSYWGAGGLASAIASWFADGTPRPIALVMLGAATLSGIALYTLARPNWANAAERP